MVRPKLKIGDVFIIPLSNGKKAYGHYIFRDGPPERPKSGLGCLVQTFDLFTDEEVSTERLRNAGPLFPPVYVGLPASLRSGRWRIIGWLPVEGFAYPKFRQTLGTKPGVYHDWSIWDGEKDIFIGDLPMEYRSLEIYCVWGDELLENRIVSGKTIHSELL